MFQGIELVVVHKAGLYNPFLESLKPSLVLECVCILEDAGAFCLFFNEESSNAEQ